MRSLPILPPAPHRTLLGRTLRRIVGAGVLVHLLLAALNPALAEGAATPEYKLKAAFIYNFARFTTWSDRPDKLIHLCVLGRDPFGSALDTIEDKEVGHFHLTVRRLRSAEEAMRTCQIVFITDAELENFMMQPEPVRAAAGILTIADHEGAARRGIIIELTTDDQKIGFEFNQDIARQRKVDVTSKVLRLARKVY